MARPPSGPIGNSPRDVRDDFVGVPAEPVSAPEPPRWPSKRKKITSNTFHAKVSGGTAPTRADRKPTFRRGGMVKGYASGGSVAAKIEKRDKLPGEDKNDPFAKQNLKKEQNLKSGGVAKRQEGGGVPLPKPDPRYHIDDGPDLEPGVAKKWNEQMGRVRGIVRGDKQPWEKNTPPGPLPRKGGGGVKKKASGGPVADYTEGPYTPGGKTVKGLSHFHPAHDFDPGTAMGSIGPKSDEAQTDEVGAERRMRDMRSGRDLRDNDWSPKEPGYPKREDRRFKKGGKV